MKKLAGLFAGIGGFETAFSGAGYETVLLSENDPAAQAVLRERFPGVELCGDVTDLPDLPSEIEVVCAGFPCQNLSMAGDKSGIRGGKSQVIDHLFRLIERNKTPVVVIENVYFMLYLNKGGAMEHLLGRLEALSYKWAYRVLDTMAFGLPQRRRRVYLVASTELDPRRVLLADDAGPYDVPERVLTKPLGFYWTEGKSGVGITVNGIPPLKGGSGIAIPSAPAVLFPDGLVETPGIEACEALQGFPSGWMQAASTIRDRLRWKLVGNSVSVPVAAWVARRISEPGEVLAGRDLPLNEFKGWPTAAFNVGDGRYAVEASARPIAVPNTTIEAYRHHGWVPLSARATAGFVSRAREGKLRFPEGFIDAVEKAAEVQKDRKVA